MKRDKEPSLLRQLIRIHYEQALRRRALRNLAKVEWSIDFLTETLRHAADMLNKDIEIEVETKGGHKLHLSSVKDRNTMLAADNDIFNHLDDQAAIDRFIRNHQPRR